MSDDKRKDINMNKTEAQALNLDDLDNVVGGISYSAATHNKKNAGTNEATYVDAVCEHCGMKGKHLMNTGRTAICSRCGQSINLIAQ